MARRDNTFAAKVLAEAHFHTDEKVAEKYGITRRTVVTYRAAQKDDTELSQLFQQRLDEIAHREWADQLSETLTTALRRIGVELSAVKVESLQDLTQVMSLTKELVELEMSRMYAESETRGDDRTADLAAGQGPRAADTAEASRLLS